MSLEKWQETKEKAESALAQMERDKGRYMELMKQVKEACGKKTLEEAEEEVQRLRRELAKSKQILAKELEMFKRDYGKQLEEPQSW